MRRAHSIQTDANRERGRIVMRPYEGKYGGAECHRVRSREALCARGRVVPLRKQKKKQFYFKIPLDFTLTVWYNIMYL